MQKWKKDPKLHSCKREEGKKKLDYYGTYVDEFLNADELRDWESFERCKKLWMFCDKHVGGFKEQCRVLDCGTKDGQFPEWLVQQGYDALGIDISKPYIEYALSKDRPVMDVDVCNMHFYDNIFDIVFSHHLLGLTSDYRIAIREMFRVTSPNGYFISLNDCPGNQKKHFHYISSSDDLKKEVSKCRGEVLYFDYFKNKKEFLIIIRKADFEWENI